MKVKRGTEAPRSFLGVRLFLDEMELIVDMMARGGVRLTISDRDHEYDSLDDLLKHRGPRPKDFNIQVFDEKLTSETIRLSFWDGGIFLISSDPPPPVYSQIKDLIERHNWNGKPLLFILTIPALIPPIALIGLIGLAGGVGALFLIGSILAYYRLFHFGVFLRRRHEGGFFKRNVEDWGKAVVGAVLGSGITLLIQYMRGCQ